MSIIRTTFIAAVLTAGFVGSAFAREPVATVRLSAAVAESTQVIAVNTLWNCAADACQARPSHAISVRACRQFVREAGAGVRIVSYGNEERALNADELARCNGDTLQAANQ